ncbi:hypothetical protein [Pseudomonas sp. MWU13-2105]|uniref:hypothetical protein n=1 Tax=Pseudomonas sp. MWU13-2105 TaxID=2935074 RepID=UPI00200CD744|nr:hypothetical protein [Pseudomonas sp. MWU13-2105]
MARRVLVDMDESFQCGKIDNLEAILLVGGSQVRDAATHNLLAFYFCGWLYGGSLTLAVSPLKCRENNQFYYDEGTARPAVVLNKYQ